MKPKNNIYNNNKKNNKVNNNDQKQTIKKLWSVTKKHWILILTSLLLSTLSVFFTLYIPKLTGDAIDLVIGKGNVDFTAIFLILQKIIVIILLTAIMQWLINLCNNSIVYKSLHDIREEAMRKIENLPLKYIDTHSYGDIVSRIIVDADQLAECMLMIFNQLFVGIVTIITTFVFLLLVDFKIAMVVLLLTPLSLFVVNYITTKTYKYFSLQTKTRGEATSLIDEMIGNLKVVQAFSYEDKALERFDESNERLEQHTLKAIFYSSIANPTTRFFNGIVYAGVGFVGALSVIANGMTVGQLVCVLNYSRQYAKPFNDITGVIAELQNALACAARIFELIEEEPEKPERIDALECKEIDGNVNLENVYFSYTKERPLIENFNLHVKAGQRIAIVGPTGCGKTTLINLLMRFYDINSGKICVDGHDINTMTRKSLRTNYGMVLQDTWIKTGTIRENITIGKRDATLDEIIQAAKSSYAHYFIERLPKGYDTVISEKSGFLSEGQKQLLCITRVMLCLPPMLILDEATSSIDTRTEIEIQHGFERLMKGRTSFIVAHRLSTIQDADIILVMKQGNIIEIGNHEELLKMQGFYSELYNSQFAQ